MSMWPSFRCKFFGSGGGGVCANSMIIKSPHRLLKFLKNQYQAVIYLIDYYYKKKESTGR